MELSQRLHERLRLAATWFGFAALGSLATWIVWTAWWPERPWWPLPLIAAEVLQMEFLHRFELMAEVLRREVTRLSLQAARAGEAEPTRRGRFVPTLAEGYPR